MQITEKQLFDKIENLTKTVKQEFRKKGIVLPSRDRSGNIHIGSYTAVKDNNAWYVKDRRGAAVAGPLNLAQTAIVIANDLALGRLVDYDLVNNDRWYGFKAFDEYAAKIHADKALKNHDADRAGYNLELATIAGEKKNYYRKSIDSRFSKLCRLI